MEMEQTPHSPRRNLFIGLGAAIGLIIVIALVTFAIFGSSRRDDSINTDTQTAKPVATKDEVKKNLDTLDASMQKAKTDLEAANAALKDDKNQVKVGS
jgi:flagellar basal body-associated protein FliL